jgi:hypothetical protein
MLQLQLIQQIILFILRHLRNLQFKHQFVLQQEALLEAALLLYQEHLH